MSADPKERLEFAGSFTELVVYRKARALSRGVFQITKRFPKEEAYALTDQWWRAARSIGAQIAVAWAKRRYPIHFTSKLSDADGEQCETQYWTIVAFDDGYISREEAQSLGGLAQEIGRMLGAMIQNAASFRGEEHTSVFREDSPPFDPEDLNTEH